MWRPTSPGSPGQTSSPRQATGRRATSQPTCRINGPPAAARRSLRSHAHVGASATGSDGAGAWGRSGADRRRLTMVDSSRSTSASEGTVKRLAVVLLAFALLAASVAGAAQEARHPHRVALLTLNPPLGIS